MNFVFVSYLTKLQSQVQCFLQKYGFMGTQQCNIHILETHSNITSHGYSKKIMIHIENNKSILKDTEMTSSVGKPYTIIETKSLPYL